MTEQARLRAGIVGLGVGKAHAAGYRQSQDTELVAICDVNTERLQVFGDEWDVKLRYTDYAAMLRDANLDVVSVCVPNALHAKFSVAALAAGMHVLCEKPMAISLEEGREMHSAARQHQRHLMVAYNYRYRPDTQWMNRLVHTGRLGAIYHAVVSWRRETGVPGWGVFGSKAHSGGGALFDLGVHVLDLALWMMDFPQVATVSASTRTLFGNRGLKTWRGPGNGPQTFDVDDGGAAFVRMANGATMYMYVTWAEHVTPHQDDIRVELYGTEGSLVLNIPKYGYGTTVQYFTEFEGVPSTVVPSFSAPEHPTHVGLIEDLMSAVVHGVEPATNADQGIRAVEILEAVYRSSEEGREVALTPG